jgi:hypothetical protein
VDVTRRELIKAFLIAASGAVVPQIAVGGKGSGAVSEVIPSWAYIALEDIPKDSLLVTYCDPETKKNVARLWVGGGDDDRNLNDITVARHDAEKGELVDTMSVRRVVESSGGNFVGLGFDTGFSSVRIPRG